MISAGTISYDINKDQVDYAVMIQLYLIIRDGVVCLLAEFDII